MFKSIEVGQHAVQYPTNPGLYPYPFEIRQQFSDWSGPIMEKTKTNKDILTVQSRIESYDMVIERGN